MKPARIVSWMLIGLVFACLWNISKSDAMHHLAAFIINLF
jgi:hypothetical protein